MGLDDRAHNLPAALGRNHSALLRQFLARDGEDAVAFAKRGAVESIGGIEPDFMRLGQRQARCEVQSSTSTKSRRAVAGGMRDDDYGMRSPTEIARVDFPGCLGRRPLPDWKPRQGR